MAELKLFGKTFLKLQKNRVSKNLNLKKAL